MGRNTQIINYNCSYAVITNPLEHVIILQLRESIIVFKRLFYLL